MMSVTTSRRFALVFVAGLAGLLMTMLQTDQTVSAAPPPLPNPTPVLVTNSGVYSSTTHPSRRRMIRSP